MKTYNPSIDIFRFLLILYIVLFHYTTGYNGINGVEQIYFPYIFKYGGSVGTTLFFILAGYFMGPKLFNGSFTNLKEYLRYCVDRYMRFWPTYAIAVVLIFVWLLFLPVPGKEVNFAKFLANFFIIVFPGQRVDGAHWFLATLLEVQCITAIVKFAPPIGEKSLF